MSPGVPAAGTGGTAGTVAGRRLALIGATGVGLAALLLYVLTLAPTVTFVDSGELIVVAATLGVAHPPGVPLYTLLAHAATWLPFGSIAERVHLFSALCAALAAGLVALTAAVVVTAAPPAASAGTKDGARRKGGSKGRVRARQPGAMPVITAVVVAGLLIATSRTLWAYATIAEVYTLNGLIIAAAFLLMILWRERALASAPEAPAPAGLLYATALVLGLGLANHHVTTGLMFPGLGLLLISTARRRPVPLRAWIIATLCGTAGVALYLYLPVAAARTPLINWGDPDTLERFWWHVSGRQYQVFLSFSWQTMAEQLRGDFVRYLLREFGPRWLPVTLVLAAAGFAWLRGRDRTLAWALAVAALVDLAYALNYTIDEDKDAYYLPIFLLIATMAGLGAARVMTWAAAETRRAVALAAVATVAVAPAASFVSNLRYDNRRAYRLAEDYIRNIFTTVAPDGMLLTLDWQVYSPLLYERHIAGVRPDVTAIDVNLLRRSWYFQYLEREYPALLQQTRPQVDAYLEDLRHWEEDPDLYQRDAGLNHRITDRFHGLILAFIEAHRARHPVYITLDLLAQDRELPGRLAKYAQVPQGLVFQLTDDTTFVPPADPPLQMRGLFDGTLTFEPDDVVRMKVAPVYVAMLINRGRYLERFGHDAEAQEVYRRARALAPEMGTLVPAVNQ